MRLPLGIDPKVEARINAGAPRQDRQGRTHADFDAFLSNLDTEVSPGRAKAEPAVDTAADAVANSLDQAGIKAVAPRQDLQGRTNSSFDALLSNLDAESSPSRATAEVVTDMAADATADLLDQAGIKAGAPKQNGQGRSEGSLDALLSNVHAEAAPPAAAEAVAEIVAIPVADSPDPASGALHGKDRPVEEVGVGTPDEVGVAVGPPSGIDPTADAGLEAGSPRQDSQDKANGRFDALLSNVVHAQPSSGRATAEAFAEMSVRPVADTLDQASASVGGEGKPVDDRGEVAVVKSGEGRNAVGLPFDIDPKDGGSNALRASRDTEASPDPATAGAIAAMAVISVADPLDQASASSGDEGKLVDPRGDVSEGNATLGAGLRERARNVSNGGQPDMAAMAVLGPPGPLPIAPLPIMKAETDTGIGTRAAKSDTVRPRPSGAGDLATIGPASRSSRMASDGQAPDPGLPIATLTDIDVTTAVAPAGQDGLARRLALGGAQSVATENVPDAAVRSAVAAAMPEGGRDQHLSTAAAEPVFTSDLRVEPVQWRAPGQGASPVAVGPIVRESARQPTARVAAAPASAAAPPTDLAQASARAIAAPLRAIVESAVKLAAAPLADMASPATAARLAPARTMTLQLSYGELGTIGVRMHLVGQSLDLKLAVADKRTEGLIGREREALSGALRDHNFEVRSLVIEGRDAPPSGDNNGSANNNQGGASLPGSGQRGSARGGGWQQPSPKRAVDNGGRDAGGGARPGALFV